MVLCYYVTEIKLQDSVETVCRDETEELVDSILKKLRKTKLEECFGVTIYNT